MILAVILQCVCVSVCMCVWSATLCCSVFETYFSAHVAGSNQVHLRSPKIDSSSGERCERSRESCGVNESGGKG